MKTGALILAAFAMGALVTTALLSRDEPARKQARVERRVETEPRKSTSGPVARPASSPAPGPALLHVPRLRLNETIGTRLDRGPAWWPITGRPGGGDTIAIAGHRTTHTRPFYWLERLRSGDSIYIRWHGRIHAYRVSRQRIFSAKNQHIGDARGHEVLLLTTCTPKGSARQRLVVYALPRDAGE